MTSVSSSMPRAAGGQLQQRAHPPLRSHCLARARWPLRCRSGCPTVDRRPCHTCTKRTRAFHEPRAIEICSRLGSFAVHLADISGSRDMSKASLRSPVVQYPSRTIGCALEYRPHLPRLFRWRALSVCNRSSCARCFRHGAVVVLDVLNEAYLSDLRVLRV